MSKNTFRKSGREIIRSLWLGEIDVDQFTSDYKSLINRRLTESFDSVAQKYGFSPSEYTNEQQLWLGRFISEQQSFAENFANDISENSKANGGKLSPLLERNSNYVDQWNAVAAKSETYFSSGKLIWNLGKRERHCNSCLDLDGLIKSASDWQKFGILPKDFRLECKGIRCGCTLTPTNQPISKRDFPNI